jgi:hypothetical protein
MPRGRPITSNVKENKDYFRNYYHETNEEFICECGCKCKLHSKRRHLLSQKHIQLMESKQPKDQS